MPISKKGHTMSVLFVIIIWMCGWGGKCGKVAKNDYGAVKQWRGGGFWGAD